MTEPPRDRDATELEIALLGIRAKWNDGDLATRVAPEHADYARRVEDWLMDQECTCEEDSFNCWYRLSDEQQAARAFEANHVD
jgi:hypothetical protein